MPNTSSYGIKLGSDEYTATLALDPASLATAFISIKPDVISGIQVQIVSLVNLHVF